MRGQYGAPVVGQHILIGSWLGDLKARADATAADISQGIEHRARVRIAIAAVGAVSALGLAIVLARMADPT